MVEVFLCKVVPTRGGSTHDGSEEDTLDIPMRSFHSVFTNSGSLYTACSRTIIRPIFQPEDRSRGREHPSTPTILAADQYVDFLVLLYTFFHIRKKYAKSIPRRVWKY